ncbi:MAG TPA: hypothetical protein VD994_21090 [Prosthecobacter sp.]|nr:hypothetical protein [Prosthecobacter sp.]
MSSSDFSQAVIDLIRRCTPTFAAVELLVFLQMEGERNWSAEELLERLKPRGFTLTSIEESLRKFERCSLVEADGEGRIRFGPSAEMDSPVKLLVAAYHERPVSLIRVIYAVADDHIQSFADSFRLKPE